MLFNTFNFLLFFLIVFSLNYALRKIPLARYSMLLVASYYFYAYWNAHYLFLIILSTLLDFVLALLIERSASKSYRKNLLIFSIISNLTILGIFKYYNFFIDSIYDLFVAIGLPFQYSSLELILPVGISFYTFQSMSYSIDVYKREIRAEKDFVRFALYIAFFPQLVAGPIIRARDFLPQYNLPFSLTKKDFFVATTLIWIGVFKKSVLAEFFGKYSDNYFSTMSEFHSIYDLFLGTYSFAMQIYFDFSGYTDTAIGLALLLGFKVPINFFYPYAASSLSDFWRRWHISLSSWFRDYLYIPLGGNKTRKNRNLLATFGLSGIWHGAAYHFALWGVLHGVLLIIESYLKKHISFDLPLFAKRLIVFHLVCIGWLIFRVEHISDLFFVADHLNLAKNGFLFGELLAFFGVITIIIYQHNYERFSIKTLISKTPFVLQTIFHALLFVLVIALGSFGTPFIYFQF